jgi:hypothetical protein
MPKSVLLVVRRHHARHTRADPDLNTGSRDDQLKQPAAPFIALQGFRNQANLWMELDGKIGHAHSAPPSHSQTRAPLRSGR